MNSSSGGIACLEACRKALGAAFDTLKGSKHPHMKELRIRHRGDAYRVLFAFDPRRVAVLLLGGRKGGGSWYDKTIPAADKLYDRHIAALHKEGI
jgi:hypothetical protein